jgi:hypothetical protein
MISVKGGIVKYFICSIVLYMQYWKQFPNLAETAAVSCHPRGVKAALSAATRAAKPALSALLGYS